MFLVPYKQIPTCQVSGTQILFSIHRNINEDPSTLLIKRAPRNTKNEMNEPWNNF